MEPGCIDEILETDGGRRVGWLARGPEDGAPILYLHGCPGSRLEQRLIPSDVLSRFGADDDDRREMLEVAALMETMRAPR
jgi:hypothetical protein